MRYRVRSPEGELRFESLREVAHAYAQGLVGPEDEVRAEDSPTWRQARSVPELAAAAARGRGGGAAEAGAQWGVVAACGALGALALALLWRESPRLRLAGLALALVVTSLLTRVTWRAFRRRPPGA